jgi:hypothetical protein
LICLIEPSLFVTFWVTCLIYRSCSVWHSTYQRGSGVNANRNCGAYPFHALKKVFALISSWCSCSILVVISATSVLDVLRTSQADLPRRLSYVHIWPSQDVTVYDVLATSKLLYLVTSRRRLDLAVSRRKYVTCKWRLDGTYWRRHNNTSSRRRN